MLALSGFLARLDASDQRVRGKPKSGSHINELDYVQPPFAQLVSTDELLALAKAIGKLLLIQTEPTSLGSQKLNQRAVSVFMKSFCQRASPQRGACLVSVPLYSKSGYDTR